MQKYNFSLYVKLSSPFCLSLCIRRKLESYCLVSPVGLKMTVEQNSRKMYSISRRTDDHRKPVLIPSNATKKTTPKQNTDRRPS